MARSTFPSQNVQSWKLRCSRSARCCGAKHMSKSKCTKHTTFRALLEVQMSKKCTPLWREAHVEVKMYKAHHVQSTFGSSDVEKVHAVVARSTCRSYNVRSTPGSEHFLKFGALLCGRRKGLCTLPKVSKTRGLCRISKNAGRRGAFEEDLQRCISRGGAVQETCLGRQGADFMRGVAFWSVC